MKNCTQQQYDDLQAQIREARLKDFKVWVQENCDVMGDVERRGDTRTIYKTVETLMNKREKPEPNLITNGKGKTLESAKDVVQRW